MVVSRPASFRLFGQGHGQGSVARQISRRLPPSFHPAVEAYWQVVKEWSDGVTAQLKSKFETYVENYRAQAGQILGGRELSKDELNGIQESLATLHGDAQRHTGDAPPHGIPAPQEETV
jgi:hypothetical protein